jgi:hypothetical protein
MTGRAELLQDVGWGVRMKMRRWGRVGADGDGDTTEVQGLQSHINKQLCDIRFTEAVVMAVPRRIQIVRLVQIAPPLLTTISPR